MVRFKMGADSIQFWMLVILALGAIAKVAMAIDSRYAHEDIYAADTKELHWEVHQLYMNVLTPDQLKRAEAAREKDRASQSQ